MVPRFLQSVLLVAFGIGLFILWRTPPPCRNAGSHGSRLRIPRARGPPSGALLDLAGAPANPPIVADRRWLPDFHLKIRRFISRRPLRQLRTAALILQN